MSPRKTWSDVRDYRLHDPNSRARYDRARAELDAELVTYQQTLAELRRARSLTQAQLGQVLEVSQAQVSRIEHQADLYLSTLRSYVEAMGGELELTAAFADGGRVQLVLADLLGEDHQREAATG